MTNFRAEAFPNHVTRIARNKAEEDEARLAEGSEHHHEEDEAEKKPGSYSAPDLSPTLFPTGTEQINWLTQTGGSSNEGGLEGEKDIVSLQPDCEERRRNIDVLSPAES
ncbi:hypothetical protein DL771_011969 [Monosporascus sp. 5C6A]|nr:hypothetical protein DL771_011969 [Monosporascus sp. 5C6A]